MNHYYVYPCGTVINTNEEELICFMSDDFVIVNNEMCLAELQYIIDDTKLATELYNEWNEE